GDRVALQSRIDELSEDEIGDLSPAEKYDLFLGDPKFSLTRNIYKMVDELSDDNRTAAWTGICHGWSPASLSLPHPWHAFKVRAAQGQMITFYPADIRALESYLWGKSLAQEYVKVEGTRCREKAPAEDINGRILQPECFDVNPGMFHLVAVNQL